MKTSTVRIIALGMSVVVIFGLAALLLGKSEPYKNANGISADMIMIEMEGDYSVTADEYFYYALNSRENYKQQNGETIFDMYPYMASELLLQMDGMIINSNAYMLWGTEEGFELAQEDYDEFDTQLEGLKAQLKNIGKNVNDYFRENNLTVELFRKIYLRDLYVEKFLSEYLTPDHPSMQVTNAQIDEFAKEKGFLGAKHILILAEDEADKEEKRADAEELLAKLKDGGDFDSLMAAVTEDPGIANYPDGYTFEPGEFVPEFEQAVKALKVGELSGIVETDYGFHIIKRIDTDRITVKLRLQQELFAQKTQEYEEKLNPRATPEREALVLTEMLPVIR